MSITADSAKKHANDPAVTCCRFEAGANVEPSILEDPGIFPDLLDTGLLEISDDVLTIGEVLGAKLTQTLDALTPITRDMVEGLIEKKEEDEETSEELTTATAEGVQMAEDYNAPQAQATQVGGYIHVRIGEGKDIEFSIPMVGGTATGGMAPQQSAGVVAGNIAPEVTSEKINDEPEQIKRKLLKKYYRIDEVKRGPETKFDGHTLIIREGIEEEAVKSEKLVTDLKIEIITEKEYNQYSETIMDVQPIATKEEGDLGEGVTRVLDNVVMVVTGTDENGVQIGEFGSSEGPMDRNIMWNRPGAPDFGDIFIKTQVTIKAGTNMERPGPLAAHHASDIITEEIRQAFKKAELELEHEEEFIQKASRHRKKVLIVKEIMGQGAMHDNLIIPVEPVGTLGAKPNVDLGNLPVMLSPLEVLDGGIHALTCIGPASKENSRHYFREPLVMRAMYDEDIDLCGVLFVGSPQINAEKFYVSKRLGMTIEAIEPDGVIITTEGFGNNHIDFASHHEQVGMRGIPVVGMSFCAVQGALVVGNKYMTAMVDNNKSKQGIENEILCNNTLCDEDAIRALEMLKAVMDGEEVVEPERKWNPNVKINNVELIENQKGTEFHLVDNEQVLEKSKKRAEIYEKED